MTQTCTVQLTHYPVFGDYVLSGSAGQRMFKVGLELAGRSASRKAPVRSSENTQWSIVTTQL